MTDIDLAALEPITERYRGRGRDALLPFLHEAQAVYGWLPEQVQAVIAEMLRVPLAEVHGVIEFYSMFYNQPTARRVVRICTDPVCALLGAEEVAASASRSLEDADHRTEMMVDKVTCIGLCDHAPAALIGDDAAGSLSADQFSTTFNSETAKLPDRVYADLALLLKRVGKIDPTSIDEYRQHGGYDALQKAIQNSPKEFIQGIMDSGILGRGGAMFPIGRKWLLTRDAGDRASERYVVVNADESEPGAFKDRVLMEGDPFVIIEAATMAAYAVGARKGWIFVRGEYPLCFERLQKAIEEAGKRGFLGKDIMGIKGFDFEIEIRRGAGAYICGEETALFEAIEGRRGFPRKKPPFPVTKGLFQRPTVINNVETLAAVVAAVNLGIDKWKTIGTEQSPGTKLFCVSGHVRNPGTYEMPFGVTIRELIEKAGGMSSENPLAAVLVGGAAGVFIGQDKLDMPLTYEHSKEFGVPLGSGALVVFDASTDLRRVLYQIGRFFAHESCGKCFPCQLGTQRQMEILEEGALLGTLSIDQLRSLDDVAFAMTQTSLCGLGQTAASATISAIEQWPEIYGESK